MSQNKVKTAVEQQVVLLQDFVLKEKELLHEIASLIVATFHEGGRMFICGRGPFGSVASLLGQTFVNRQTLERPALPAIALSNDAGLATFLAAENQSDQYFSRQLRALASGHDVALLLAGSFLGRAEQEVVTTMRELGGRVILIASAHVETSGVLPDATLAIPADSEPRLLETTLMIGNLLCNLIEGDLFGF